MGVSSAALGVTGAVGVGATAGAAGAVGTDAAGVAFGVAAGCGGTDARPSDFAGAVSGWPQPVNMASVGTSKQQTGAISVYFGIKMRPLSFKG